jgi:membrane-associated protease RseP (regulator of RpoE activity)
MNILEKFFSRLFPAGNTPEVDPFDERKVIKDPELFLRELSVESSKCLREGGRLLLLTFATPLIPGDKIREFEEKLVKKFRLYDVVAKLSPNLYSIGVISLKPLEDGKGIGVAQILSRVRETLKEVGLDPEELNYAFKVAPYDGTDARALLKMSLKELQKEKMEYSLPVRLSET